MSLNLTALLSSLAIGLVISMVYFGFLALVVRSLGALTPKQTMLVTTLSFPVRLGLLGLVMAWVVRINGLVGALALLPGLFISRFVLQRWITRSKR